MTLSQSLAAHSYQDESGSIEAERIITFYPEKRYDGLSKLELDNLKMIEHYVGREDL